MQPISIRHISEQKHLNNTKTPTICGLYCRDGHCDHRRESVLNFKTCAAYELGGGVCLYINKEWCIDYTVCDQVCTPDVKLLTLSLRPFYLPREYTNVQ